MIKMVMIGCNFISQFYKMGFEQSNNVELVAVCDYNEQCFGRQFYKDLPFYTDYKQMIKEIKPDVALLLTPNTTQFNIAKDCLSMGVNVIMEKPFCATLQEVYDLYDIARANNKRVECIYHFAVGDEAVWLKNNISKYGKVLRYSFYLHEQYAWNDEHVLIKEKEHLGDSFTDAGINALSVIDFVVDLNNVRKTREIAYYDNTSGCMIYGHKTFVNDAGVEFDIMADYMTMDKTKISVIDLDTGRILIDHQKQTIYFNGECIYKNIPKIHRMHFQYINYLKNFAFDKDDEERTKRLHKILYM